MIGLCYTIQSPPLAPLAGTDGETPLPVVSTSAEIREISPTVASTSAEISTPVVGSSGSDLYKENLPSETTQPTHFTSYFTTTSIKATDKGILQLFLFHYV